MLRAARIAVLDAAGVLSAKEGDLDAAWVELANGGAVSFAMSYDGSGISVTRSEPRIAVLDGNGKLSAKEGDITAPWVSLFAAGVTKYALSTSRRRTKPRIGILDAAGNLRAMEGDLDAAWVELVNGGAVSFAMSDDRIAVLDGNGKLSAKEGELSAPWVTLVNSGVVAFVMEGARIAILDSAGNLNVKEGDLYAAWIELANDGAVSLAMSSTRIAVLDSNGKLRAKEGDLTAPWVNPVDSGVTSYALSASLSGNKPRIGVVDTAGNLNVKEGDLNAAWVRLVNGGVVSFAMSDNRIAVLDGNGKLSAKEGALSAPWVTLVNSGVVAFAMEEGEDPRQNAVRLHVIRMANDDGSNQTAVTQANMVDWVAIANQVFLPAQLQVLFDAATDFETRTNTNLNEFNPGTGEQREDDADATAKAIGDEFPNRVVVICRRSRTAANGQSGPGSGASSYPGKYVLLPDFNPNDKIRLAHELGHYFGLPHTFNYALDTTHDAAVVFNIVGQSLEALDNDAAVVSDTPPEMVIGDLDPGVANSIVFGGKTINFLRDNIMSYYRPLAGHDKTITLGQAARVLSVLQERRNSGTLNTAFR